MWNLFDSQITEIFPRQVSRPTPHYITLDAFYLIVICGYRFAAAINEVLIVLAGLRASSQVESRLRLMEEQGERTSTNSQNLYRDTYHEHLSRSVDEILETYILD